MTRYSLLIKAPGWSEGAVKALAYQKLHTSGAQVKSRPFGGDYTRLEMDVPKISLKALYDWYAECPAPTGNPIPVGSLLLFSEVT